MYPFIAFVVLLGLWSLYGYFSSRVEQTPYQVIASEKEYEIREYPAHIVAQTTVTGSYDDALAEGFRILAAYIFGANTKKEQIAMTAPVNEQKAENEKIAMTAPVTEATVGEMHTITFAMPQSYTLNTLPKPTDARIALVTLPEKTMAALRFSWFRSPERIAAKKQELLDALSRDGVSVTGEVHYAGYNAPWTPPWMIRNEVLIEVRSP